jgi:hypothetical protein
MVQSFKEVVAIWDTPDQMAADIGNNAEAVRKWKQRDSIPADWWTRVISGAKAKGVDITAHRLAILAEREQQRRRA